VRPRFTFAVVGHDEVETLPYAIEMAKGAAEPGDAVWFVDSASTDRSAEVARSLGVDVVSAPLGKGRAMQVAMDRCRDGYICFVDADYERSEFNIPAKLREVADSGAYDMVVGAFHEPTRRRTLTPALYVPLLRYLFPEVETAAELVPLSGFRVVRVGFDVGRLPAGYGVEAYLNIETTLRAGRVLVCPVGWFQGDLRGYSNVVEVGRDVCDAILELAAVRHRIDREDRPAWDAWVNAILDVIGSQPPVGAPDAEFMTRLRHLAQSPMPRIRQLEP
jgi:glycosyltransferase involved in cell wall biosynthesis